MFTISTRKRAAVAAAFCLAVFAAVAFAVKTRGGLPFDMPVLLRLLPFREAAAWLNAPALLLHYLGKTAVAVPLIALFVLWLYRRNRRREALFLAVSPLLPTLAMLSVKSWVARPRPPEWMRLAAETNYSFPSGHSSFAAALAVVLILLFYNTKCRFIAIIGGIAFAVLMGVSRLWLGVHYPSDVLAGWANGVFFALLAYALILKEKR